MTTTPEFQLSNNAAAEILRHALGLGRNGGRNYFVTGAGGSDHRICMSLVHRGLMTRHAGNALTGGDDLFMATPAGRDFAIASAPVAAKNYPSTRSQRRYDQWLREDGEMTFGEWLRMRRYS